MHPEKHGSKAGNVATMPGGLSGLLPLPKTANPQHMKTNAAVDFEISNDDMMAL